MVLTLTPDIILNRPLARFADTERAITILPSESATAENITFNPSRGAALDLFNCLAHCDSRWDSKQYVDVILHASDQERGEPVVSSDSAQVGPKSILGVLT